MEVALVRALLDTIERHATDEAPLPQLAEELERLADHCMKAAETLSPTPERRRVA